jgi:hypothetical protein
MDEILWLIVGMSKIIQAIANSLKFTTKLITLESDSVPICGGMSENHPSRAVKIQSFIH